MRLAKHVKFRQEKFGGVLFETRSEKVFTLNATAAAVVREIEAGCEQDEITAKLTDRFSGSPTTIEREVTSLIGDLRQKGLLEDSARA